jgi:hypothetical protein
MAKPNYAYEKRQRELEKKQKKENKALKKSSGTPTGAQDNGEPVAQNLPQAADGGPSPN